MSAKPPEMTEERSHDTEGGAEAVPAEAGAESLKESSQDIEVLESDLPLSTPSLMSAGADPWADPPMAAKVAETIASSRRAGGGDNPWAINTPDMSIVASSHRDEEDDSKPEITNGVAQVQPVERWGEYHLPTLGHPVARYWSFKPGLLQLNNGESPCDGNGGECAGTTSHFARLVWMLSKASV